MKPSTIVLCLIPTIALAVEADRAPSPTPSLPDTTPPAPLPEIQFRPDHQENVLGVQQESRLPERGLQSGDEAALDSGLGTPAASSRDTKTLRARSEGTLGQTPWIGMAIGLTCTALAAVMLG
ncbi:uncharacterized protein BP01DRAFT_358186 [Aspergillus saccharolyticus JOP 1030-1]|uniref:Uncharacterized protein n=1 Tax=Aspergillus saccharolyticus JOP 1030-1 TaxID=1450539 RepID=A0A318Z9J5_9EURO|nr:hypothetical protein BP01DRAFT_358186 [Aspergillus saccharolyticus JOP 1030-1]PYH44016.1 hypothetical protein BP01DRAFT_358186 [Aspergillus saccharolyticus JOP 1030-1]